MVEHEQQARIDLLETILQELQERHQTGILTIQRSKAGVRDVGTITLLNGEPVEAQAGERQGNDAIDWLYTWGRCQCQFRPQSPAELVIAPLPPPPAEAEASPAPLAFLSRLRATISPGTSEAEAASRPERARRTDRLPEQPAIYEPGRPERTHRTDRLPEQPPIHEPFKPNVARPQPVAWPETPIPPSLPAQPFFQVTQAESNTIFSTWLQKDDQPKIQAPYRLWQGQEALAYLERSHASRLHRHVFLLLDGQRTAADLVRITGRPFPEIKRLLDDLERLGMIKQANETQARWE